MCATWQFIVENPRGLGMQNASAGTSGLLENQFVQK
jgi:hypothetical protein